MTRIRRIATGIVRIETKVTGTEMPLAIHLVEGDRWLLVDTGCVGMVRDLVIPAARAERSDATIGRAVVTHAHADHFGGNAELLEAHPDCTIYAHRDDAAPTGAVVDAFSVGGQRYRGAVVDVAAP